MSWIAFVRHGVTDWNARGLIQGRTDIPLSDAGAEKLKRNNLCDAFLNAKWVTSPLTRAVQTAAILNPAGEIQVQPDLIETNWGAFEGTPRDALPQRIRELGLTPSRGLDFCPPDGESARMVRRRLRRWLATVGAPTVAVTHKGVMRSVLSLACDWDMQNEFAPPLDWSLPHLFAVDDDGVRLVALNRRWDQPPQV